MSVKRYLNWGVVSIFVLVFVMAVTISAVIAETGVQKVDKFNVNFLSLRPYAENLGAQVGWNSTKKVVEVLRGSQKVEVFTQINKVLVNGVEKKTQVMLKGGRVYLPAEFLSEIFGYSKVIAKNSKGIDVAAGSNKCLSCHANLSDWANTPHTQKAQKGYQYVVGWAAKPADYKEAAKWITENRETYIHPANKNADGSVKDPSKLGVRAVMTEKPTVTYSEKTYGVEDITIVIGSNHKQAYAVWIPGYGNKILNIRYNNIDSNSPSMGERTDERVWEGSCIGCHLTGFDPTGLDTAYNGGSYKNSPTPFNLDSYMGDLRVGCEACHGPSGSGTHKTGGQTINPAKLTQDQQIDVCGRCHGNWNSTVPGTTARKDVPEFVPGQSLVYLLSPEYNNFNGQGVDRIRRPNWGSTDPKAKPFLGNGASNDDHQEWYDFKISAHYLKTDSVTCSTCHDPHDNVPGRSYGTRILKGEYNAETGVATVCNDCHKNANFITKKGKAGAINPHTTKPYGEGVPKELWRADGKWPWEK